MLPKKKKSNPIWKCNFCEPIGTYLEFAFLAILNFPNTTVDVGCGYTEVISGTLLRHDREDLHKDVFCQILVQWRMLRHNWETPRWTRQRCILSEVLSGVHILLYYTMWVSVLRLICTLNKILRVPCKIYPIFSGWPKHLRFSRAWPPFFSGS